MVDATDAGTRQSYNVYRLLKHAETLKWCYRFESCPDYEEVTDRISTSIDKRKSFSEASPN